LSKGHDEPTRFYDCKFYPYTKPGVDPVFAVVGSRETRICRPWSSSGGGIEVLTTFEDADPTVVLNSVVWAQDPVTFEPLICVAGATTPITKNGSKLLKAPKINVFDVKSGKLRSSLTGHGKDINDLAVSPQSSSLLASASMDHTVRIWSLEKRYEEQPCLLMCAGDGHKAGLLTLAFHSTGKYLLTGGHDCVVNLWTIPELPNDDSGTDNMTIVYYPHFSSSAVHTNFVDCVAFYGDLVLSRAAHENKIVLWSINGFDSSKPAPNPDEAPAYPEFQPTRSGFGSGFQRLHQFEISKSEIFYQRFSLHVSENSRPILAIGSENSKVHFWDLQRLQEWMGDTLNDVNGDEAKKKSLKSSSKTATKQCSRMESTADSSSGLASLVSEHDFNKWSTNKRDREKYSTGNPFQLLAPHKTVTVPKITFEGRQIAWSVGGEWMVVVGGQGMIGIFGRQ
jgi:polycomb protein EED